MRRLVAIGTTVLALLAPAAARADAPVAWQHKALAVAQRVWHPACGQLRLRFAEQQPLGEAYLGDCELRLDRDVVWDAYPEFCHVVLHEGGHAAGVGHRPRGVMRPTFIFDIGRGPDGKVTWGGVDPRCLPGR